MTDALLKALCSQVMILPVRYCVDSRSGELSPALMRSVLGKALWDGEPVTYREVFRRDQLGRPAAQGYVLSPEVDARSGVHVITLTLIGNATESARAIDCAFRHAASNGVGRDRVPLSIESCVGVHPDRSLAAELVAWPLSEARWCDGHDDATTPCRLEFLVPLRLQAHRQTASGDWSHARPLIAAPSFSNLVAAGLNRLAAYLPDESRQRQQSKRAALIEAAEAVPCSEWRGQASDIERWSASQQRELQLRAITGSIELPAGAGTFWPLMAAARWLHLGKNTTHGMGAFEVVRLG